MRTHLEGFLLQVGFAEFENHSKVNGFDAHAAWLFIEVFLLKDLRRTKSNKFMIESF